MKLNRTNLNKIIKWTSSKFNEYTKKEVVDKVLKLRPTQRFECNCGSYAEGGYNGGIHYVFQRDISKLIMSTNGRMVTILEV